MTKSKGIKAFPDQMIDLENTIAYELEPLNCNVTVGWGDCDPAQIAYTARIPEWALVAIEEWYRYCLQSDWYEINLKRGIGTPFVSLSCEFLSPITPEYPLDMSVFVSKLGRSSLSHEIHGSQNSVHCFSANTTAAFVDAGKMKSVAIPPNMRSNIENYIRNQNLS